MSDLTRIQQEILRRFQRPRTTLSDIPGDSGEDLQEQLDRNGRSPDRMSGVPSSNIFAPSPRRVSDAVPLGGNQPTSGRSTAVPVGGEQPNVERSTAVPLGGKGVFASPQQLVPVDRDFERDYPNYDPKTGTSSLRRFSPPPQPNVTDFRSPADYPNKTLPPVSMTRDRRTQPRDHVADDSQYLRDLEDNPRNWKDKAVDALRAANQAFGSNPNIFTPTKRERAILKAEGMLGRDVAIQKEQRAQEAAEMVPIYDKDGNVIGTAPRRTAAVTQIRATDTTTRADETKRRNDAYIADIERRPQKEQAEAARKIYQSGVADGDEEFKADLGRRMGLTEKLPDSTKGTVQTDANGNFTVVHPRTATAETVTDKETGKPKQSWVITREQRIDDRARRSQAAAMERTIVMAQATGARLGNPDDLDAIASEAQANADQATAKAQELSTSTKPSDKKLAGEYLSEAGRHKAQAAKAREAASKARSGQNIKSASPRTFNEKAFKAKFQEKYKRQPTEAEIAPYRNARP